jgi:MFS family permease
VQRVGHVRVFAAMTAAASAVPLLHGLWVELWLWTLLRLVTGYCFAVLYVVIESWLNEQSNNETRGAVFSAYTLITLTVLAAGQQMLVLYDPRDIPLFALTSVLVSLASIPVVMSIGPSPAHEETEVRLDIPKLLRTSKAGAMGCLAAGLANGSFWSLAPVFVAGYSPDVSLVAWFMTAAVLGGALGQWPLGLWSDRVDRRWVMAFACSVGLASGAVIFFAFQGLGLWGLLALGAVWGGTAFPLYAVAVAQANDQAEPGEYVQVSSGLLLMYGVGAVVGPFLAPAVMRFTSAGGLFLFTALVHLVLLAYLVLRIPRKAAVPEEDHRPFSDSLASTQTASHVYEEELSEGQLEEESRSGTGR